MLDQLIANVNCTTVNMNRDPEKYPTPFELKEFTLLKPRVISLPVEDKWEAARQLQERMRAYTDSKMLARDITRDRIQKMRGRQ